MIGPAVPVPVPQQVLDALTGVEVTTTAGRASGFKLTFTLHNQSPLHTLFLLSGGAAIPLIRVIIAVSLNGTPDVLMDGVMTQHEVTPGTEAGHSTLTVMGEDLTRVMDYIDFSGFPYPAVPVEGRVALILAKYALFGIVPVIIPTVLMDVSLPTERIPRQQGKDLAYIRQLANEVGYVFYVEPGPLPGMNIAYWGPEIKVGIPQPALNINMDAHTNVESLSFRFNSDSRTQPIVNIQEPFTKTPIPIPIPDISPLNPPARPGFGHCKVDRADDGDGKNVTGSGSTDRHDRGGQISRGDNGLGKPRCPSLWSRPKGSTTGGRAWRRGSVRWPALCEERDPHHQARGVQREFYLKP